MTAKDLLKEIKKNHTDLQISTKSAGADWRGIGNK